VKVTINKEENNLDAILSVVIEKKDYYDTAMHDLKNAKKQLNLPGFRKGMVPLGIAKKYLWENTLKESIEKLIEMGINDHIKENKLEILKPLIPVKADKEIDWKTDEEFRFDYRIGMLSDFEFDALEIIKNIPRYTIPISDEDIENEIKQSRLIFGKHLQPEKVEDFDDLRLHLDFLELDDDKVPVEGGLQKKLSNILKELPDAVREALLNKAKNDEIDIDIKKAFPDIVQLSEFLLIEELAAKDLNPIFRIKVLGIYKIEPAELNEKFFKNASSDMDIKNEEEFRSFVSDKLEENNKQSCTNYLKQKIHSTLLEKLNLELPPQFCNTLFEEEFKKEIKEKNAEELSTERKQFETSLRWTYLLSRLVEEYSIEVSENEIIQNAFMHISSQLYYYGMTNTDQETLTGYVKEYLKNPDNVNYTEQQIRNSKLLDLLAGKIETPEKEISRTELEKLQNSDSI
jgi:trigger factor